MAVKRAKNSLSPKGKLPMHPEGEFPAYPKGAPKAVKAAPKKVAPKKAAPKKVSKAAKATVATFKAKASAPSKDRYNEDTMKVLRDADAGKNLVHYSSLEEMFEKWEVDLGKA
jgi:hypothetical protein